MKKLFNLILFLVTSLLLLSCEKEPEYPGAYPFNRVMFYDESTVSKKDSTRVLFLDYTNWDKKLYPMTLWVDNENIATINSSGYLTGKELGVVTIYSEVMGVNGLLKDSVKYTVEDILTDLTSYEIYTLKGCGVDKNNDNKISATELERTTSLYVGKINSNLLFKLERYFINLEEANVIADTTSKTLDLSMFKLKKIQICDWYYDYASNNPCCLGPDDEEYEEFKSHFITEIKLNNAVEYLSIISLPGIKTIDLRQYTNLKEVSRPELRGATPWRTINIILPKEVEIADLYKAEIVGDESYSKLNKLTYNFQGYGDVRKNKYVEINKSKFPNLREIVSYQGIRTIDISTYDAVDIDYIKVNVDTVYVSPSMYDDRYSDNRLFGSFNILVK